jgi:4-amino-4-deoxy-L-arabinose transferase-like glycosyltransferase
MTARGIVRRYGAIAAVLAMTLAASIVRLRYGLGERIELQTPDGSVYQAAAEDMLSRGVLASGVPDIPYYPAGYAVLLTGLYDLFGLDLRVVTWVQVLMLAVATLSLYVLVAREFSRTVGVLAVLFVCLNPVFAAVSTRVMYETPLMLCLILGLDFASRGARADGDRGATAWTAAACLFIGLGAALQPKVLPIGLFAIGFVLLRRRAGGRPTARPLLAMAAISLVALSLAPVAQVVRNGAADGDYVLAANTGVNLVGGLNDLASGRYDESVLGAVYDECDADPRQLVEWDRKLTGCALEWLVTHPKRAVELTYPKFWNLWGGFIGPTTPPTRWRAIPIEELMPEWPRLEGWVGNGALGYATTAVILLTSLAGAAIGLARRRLRSGSVLLLAPVVMILGLSLVTWAEPRYRIPASPFYSVFAALAVVSLVQRWLGRKRWPLLLVDAGVALTVFALLARPIGFRIAEGFSALQWACLVAGPLLAVAGLVLLRRRARSEVGTVLDARPGGGARWLFVANVGLAAITLAYHAEDFGFRSSSEFGWKQQALLIGGVVLAVGSLLALAREVRRSRRLPPGVRVPLAIAAVELLVFAVLIEQTAVFLTYALWNHPVMPTIAGVIIIVLAASVAGRRREPRPGPVAAAA